MELLSPANKVEPGRRAYLTSGDERRITLRFAPAAARQAAERWPGTARLQPDGSAAVTFEATPNEFLLGQVLGWGGLAEVVAPAEVREQLRARVATLQSRYRTPRYRTQSSVR